MDETSSHTPEDAEQFNSQETETYPELTGEEKEVFDVVEGLYLKHEKDISDEYLDRTISGLVGVGTKFNEFRKREEVVPSEIAEWASDYERVARSIIDDVELVSSDTIAMRNQLKEGAGEAPSSELREMWANRVVQYGLGGTQRAGRFR